MKSGAKVEGGVPERKLGLRLEGRNLDYDGFPFILAFYFTFISFHVIFIYSIYLHFIPFYFILLLFLFHLYPVFTLCYFVLSVFIMFSVICSLWYLCHVYV